MLMPYSIATSSFLRIGEKELVATLCLKNNIIFYYIFSKVASFSFGEKLYKVCYFLIY